MDGKEGAGRTVLVVEDHDDTRTLLRRLLESQDYKVEEAADGRQAIEALGCGCPDLILMDLHLPGLDGVEATKLVRELKGVCCHVPVIAVTAYDGDEQRRRAILAGCNDYVTKPPNQELLLEKVRTLLDAGQSALMAERLAKAMHSG